jgi:hypoxanthine-DNA glycosylase
MILFDSVKQPGQHQADPHCTTPHSRRQDIRMRKHSFPPVVDRNTRLLILGSLPGEQSLAHQQYYAHPQNAFWRLLSDVLGIDLRSMDYASRLMALLGNGVGLWDVVAEATRSGSLDSRIVDHSRNDLAGLIATLPMLETIAFNGGTAARIGMKALQTMGETGSDNGVNYRILSLPSSSPAYTLAYAEKLACWRALRETDA